MTCVVSGAVKVLLCHQQSEVVILDHDGARSQHRHHTEPPSADPLILLMPTGRMGPADSAWPGYDGPGHYELPAYLLCE